MGTAPVFGSVGEALEVVRAGLAFVAAADATELTAEEQAEALRELERANSVAAAARTSVLGAFTAGKGYAADAGYSARAWLMHQTGITKGASAAYTAWVKRAARHPRLYAAMTAEDLSESYARTLCTWTDKLPADKRDEADAILAGEANAGLGLRDLAELAAEILARCRPDEPDPDTGDSFDDRSVTVQTTFQGAGVMHGDLTPECASIVGAVLDALAGPAGAGDDRSKEQRYHDALHEAMRRLVAGGLLPERAGQPVRALVHVTLADLIRLDGKAAEAAACDASLTPVVTGDIDPGVLEDLVRLCARLDRLRRDGDPGTPGSPGAPGAPGGPQAPGLTVREALEQQVIGAAVALVSGPGGLASHLRRRQLGARLAGPSLPLDIGVSTDIPAAIRRAVTGRDQHCRFPGGCDQPAAACEVHHLTHKADGGKTSVQDCALFCTFHHQVVIHRQGWTVILNPDGTITAWNKDKTKTLHSHSRNHRPPARPG